jgi:hypothetical protein
MSQKTPEGKRFPMSFRTTAELRDKINDAAKSSGRSVAQELEWRLERSFLSAIQMDQAPERLKELETASREDRVTISRLTELLMAARDELAGKSGQDRVAPPVAATSDVTRPRQAGEDQYPPLPPPPMSVPGAAENDVVSLTDWLRTSIANEVHAQLRPKAPRDLFIAPISALGPMTASATVLTPDEVKKAEPPPRGRTRFKP